MSHESGAGLLLMKMMYRRVMLKESENSNHRLNNRVTVVKSIHFSHRRIVTPLTNTVPFIHLQNLCNDFGNQNREKRRDLYLKCFEMIRLLCFFQANSCFCFFMAEK